MHPHTQGVLVPFQVFDINVLSLRIRILLLFFSALALIIMSTEIENLESVRQKIINGTYKLLENCKKNSSGKHWRTFRLILGENNVPLKHLYTCTNGDCFRVINTNLSKDGTGKLNRHYTSCNNADRRIDSIFEREFRPSAAKKLKLKHKAVVNEAAVSFVVNYLRPIDAVTKSGMITLLAVFTLIGSIYGRMNFESILQILPSRFSVYDFCNLTLFTIEMRIEYVTDSFTYVVFLLNSKTRKQ